MQIGHCRLPHTAVAQGKHGTYKVNLQQQLLSKQGTNHMTCYVPRGSCSRLRSSHYFSLEKKWKWGVGSKASFPSRFQLKSGSISNEHFSCCEASIILSVWLKRLQLVVSACLSARYTVDMQAMGVEWGYENPMTLIINSKMRYDQV